VRGAGRRVDARLDGVQVDREILAEQLAKAVGIDVRTRAAARGESPVRI